MAKNEQTPMMNQYDLLRQQCPKDFLLFFQMGEFYELFWDDAEKISPILGIVLTSRDGKEDGIPFCGVPVHSAASYWLKLLKMNFKIAVAEQVESPGVSKIIRREITRRYTPGNLGDLDTNGENGSSESSLMAFWEDPITKTWPVVLVETAIASLRVGVLPSEEAVLSSVGNLLPREILIRSYIKSSWESKIRYLGDPIPCLSFLGEKILRDEDQQKILISEALGDTPEWVQKISGANALLGAVFSYLKENQTSLETLGALRPFNEPSTVNLDDTVASDLELLTTIRRRSSEGSLFHHLNSCFSPQGARWLKWRLLHPWKNKDCILAQQKKTSFFFHDDDWAQKKHSLGKSPDGERILSRLLSGHMKPKDYASLRILLEKMVQVHLYLREKKCDLWPQLDLAVPWLEELEKTFQNPMGDKGSLQIFAKGYDEDLDRWVQGTLGYEEKVKKYEALLKSQTGLSSLKIRTHKSFGLLIEVSKGQSQKVPQDFIRRQTLVTGDRFTTISLAELQEELGASQMEALRREEACLDRVNQTWAKREESFRQLNEVWAQVDYSQSLGIIGRKYGYVLPKISEDIFTLKDSRHPVVEASLSNFVPNNLSLSQDQKQILITGPNMGGKSTFMRQVALIGILHQMGSFVPASEAFLPIFDQIFTRVGASDDLVRGLSTFMVEMKETATILRLGTPKSLVLLDEMGRGTSSQDGLALAAAVLESLASFQRCWTLFSTHFHELTDLASSWPSVSLWHTCCELTDQGLTFPHRLVPGSGKNSHGLDVAALAGVPSKVVSRARQYLYENNKDHQWTNN